MERFIHDETNGLDYELVGDYYLPCLKAPEPPKVGRFGITYLDNLRKHKRVVYLGLLVSGELNGVVEGIDRQAEEMFSQLVERLNGIQEVSGSIPLISTTKKDSPFCGLSFFMVSCALSFLLQLRI